MNFRKIVCKTAYILLMLTEFKAFSTDMLLEDKENVSPNLISSRSQMPLLKEISAIQSQLRKSHDSADFKDVLRNHEHFRTLTAYPENEWKDIAQDLNVYKWPQQNWYQSVAGHLFYPSDINVFLESPYKKHLIRKSHMTWACAVAAYYHHPLAQYYLAKTLDKIRSEYSDADRPEFFNKLYETSLKDLAQCLDNNDACYALGTSKQEYPYIGDDYTKGESLDIFKKGTDFKNKMGTILCQKRHLRQKEYLKLAQQGYGPAYVKAAFYTEEFEDKEEYLKKAINLDYITAWIELGDLYEEQNNLSLAQECYKEAAKRGLIEGRIQYGISLVGNIARESADLYNDEGILLFPEEVIAEAAHSFTLAGQEKDPQGWQYLSALKLKLYQKTPTKELEQEFYQALVEGIKLGDDEAYHKMYQYFSKDTFTFYVNNYGRPPQEKLYRQIQDYWKNLK